MAEPADRSTSAGGDLSDVAIVVVNYGSSALLARNLAPLSAAAPELRVIVVDNFTSSSELAALQALAASAHWTVVPLPDNRGFGGGMNAGVAAAHEAGALRTLLLNPDATIDAAAVAVLSRAVAASPTTMAAPRILRPDGTLWSGGSDLYLDDGRIRSRRRRIEGAPVFEWLTGACLMIDRELWTTIGGFDDRYFLYWEDVDLCWKVTEAGGALLLCDDAVAVHDQGGTARPDARRFAAATKSPVFYFYNIRNRLLFADLRLDAATRKRWRRGAPRVAYEVLLQGGRRQFARPLSTLRPAVRGLVAGMRGRTGADG